MALALATFLSGPAAPASGAGGAPSGDAASLPPRPSRAMTALVARILPTVVSITTHGIGVEPKGAADRPDETQKIYEAHASGFIVDPSGYIATNRHVVDGVYDIAVTFSDGRTVEAKVVWKSTVVDVAFLKVERERPLAAVTLAADQRIEIGERAIAVGNPLGLGISVSAGIVSAVDRNIKQSPYDDFIQTDAAINHGNSGGPLFNEDGEVIGINTVIYAAVDNGGSEGLGFAIPGRDVAFLIDQLKRFKEIRAGWLGARTQKFTPDMATALGYRGVTGAIVADVEPDSPAASVGLRLGDIVETVEGQPVVDRTTLARAAALSLGKTLTLGVWRDGKSTEIPVRIVEDKRAHGARNPQDARHPRFKTAADMGLDLSPIEAGVRARFKLPDAVEGLVVTTVARESAASEAGVRVGDVFVSAQMAPLRTTAALQALIDEQSGRDLSRIIVLARSPDGSRRWITLPVGL